MTRYAAYSVILVAVLGCTKDGTSPSPSSDRTVPSEPLEVVDFTVVRTGSPGTTCALNATGVPKCWGFNNSGQIGDGTTINRGSPTALSGNHVFKYLAGRSTHFCGLRPSDSYAYCWGANTYGQLGDGTTTNRSVPTLVSGNHKFVQLAAGDIQTCGLKVDFTVYCWGAGAHGQLGTGGTASSNIPVKVTGGLFFTAIASSASSVCGIAVNGEVYCWGNGVVGQLGTGSTTNRLVPYPVSASFDFNTIVAHGIGYCGIRANQVPASSYCWGYNSSGQLGDGTTTNRLVPVLIQTPLFFSALGSGASHNCGISGNQAYCWGRNYAGQLGFGGTTFTSQPTQPVFNVQFKMISSGGNHTCGVALNNAIWCWGSWEFGESGLGIVPGYHTEIPTSPVIGW